MIKNILIGFLFFLGSIFELSLIHAMNFSFALIPLNFILGVIIMHRAGAIQGAAWFIMSGLLLNFFGFDSHHWISYFTIAGVGSFLTTKFFTNRSVYALLGLGLTLFAILFVINLIISFETEQIIKILFIQIFFIIFGLYFGFLASRYIENLAKSMFIVRRRN